MEKMKCDIIQDLIPSYVDGVCSDATKECVEEHMESCEGCRRMVALCRENGISGEQMEQKELDGLKKIKQITKYKGIACCGLVVFILGYMGISIWGRGEWSDHSFPARCVMCITCICLVILSGMGFKAKKASGLLEIISGTVSAIIALSVFMLLFYFITRLQDEDGAEYIYSIIGAERIGRTLTWQMWMAHFILLIFFLYHLTCMVRQDKSCNWLLCLDVAGCYIVSECFSLLSNMLTPWEFMHIFLTRTAVVAAIGLFGIVASALIGKVSRKKRSEMYNEQTVRCEYKHEKPVWLKWGAIAVCFIPVVMAVVFGVGISQPHGSDDTAILGNGETITFVRSDTCSYSIMFDFDIMARDLTSEELDRILPNLPVTAYAHFNASNNQMVGFEGKIGDIKLVVSRSDVNLLDTSIAGEGSEGTGEISGVPVTAGYFVTRPNSLGRKTAIYFAAFTMGGTRIYVENAGPEDERERIKNELVEVIEKLINDGEWDLFQS